MEYEHDMTLAGTVARLKASIAWLRDGTPTKIGGIGCADMVAMLPIMEAAAKSPTLIDGMQSLPCAVMGDWLYIPHADGNWVSAAKLQPFSLGIIRYWRAEHAVDEMHTAACARDTGPRCATPCGLSMCSSVDKSANLHGDPVDEIADLHGEVVDAEFPGTPTIAECIAQLDVWNGHLEAAIDREAHAQLGQHANDEPAAGGRDPLEQFP